MRKLCAILSLTFALALSANAQSYSASRDDENHSGYSKGGTHPSPVVRHPIKVDKLPPRPSGMFYEMSEQGFIVIDPTAPPEMGYGEQFLTSNPFPGATGPGGGTHASQRQDEDRPFGGIQLIGFEF